MAKAPRGRIAPTPSTPVAKGPIAIIAPAHPSLTKGGAEIAAYTLYLGLRRIGVAAIFIAACPAESLHLFNAASPDEYALVTEQDRYEDFYTLSAAGAARQLLAILTERRAQLVNFHHHIHIGINSFRALAALLEIPFFVTFHDFTAICAHHGQMITRPLRRLCERAAPLACHACFPERAPEQFVLRRQLMLDALQPAAGYISPSRFVAERFIEWGLPAAKFAVVENGLHARPARRAATLSHSRGQPWVFGMFGRITPNKGMDTVLDATGLITDQPALAARIHIRVHGGLAGQTDEFTARFNAAVQAHGFLSHAGPYANEDIFALMAKCDYVLVPSTWWENSPLVIQEAFAVGRPVICTGIGGMAEKVPAGVAGLHMRPGDAGDMVRALAEAADQGVYKLLSKGMPAVADGTAMAHAYMALFRKK